MTTISTTAIHLDEREGVPNNPRLPAIHYDAAFRDDSADLATAMETRFEENGWPAQWRNGIYDFHHYHTQGHEVLGIAAGSAELVLGGPKGRNLAVRAGDVLLLPAGIAHCRVKASSDFLVIGAYPPGQSGDIVRSAPTAGIREAIAQLPFPARDPVYGQDGPLTQHWADRL
ncbi:cupin [Bosea vaviloviae]|uniref:Cupin n=1 Tax=Bosea vaviloviae TaxID=1526658 RepID=A0A1D7U1S3_9HYPH|nr:cupin [Bosea vaviloviae]AOO81327.1 cupin [Bosea vaviloviae]